MTPLPPPGGSSSNPLESRVSTPSTLPFVRSRLLSSPYLPETFCPSSEHCPFRRKQWTIKNHRFISPPKRPRRSVTGYIDVSQRVLCLKNRISYFVVFFRVVSSLKEGHCRRVMKGDLTCLHKSESLGQLWEPTPVSSFSPENTENDHWKCLFRRPQVEIP